MLRVLILDDDPLFGRTLERSLSRNEELPCAVTAVTTDEAAYIMVERAETPFDVFLVDQRLGPGPDGITVLQELLHRSPYSSAIVFASFDLDSGMQAYRAGAYRYLHKPFRPQELILILRSLCEWRTTRTERDGLRILAEVAEEAQRAHDAPSLGAVIVAGACRFGFGRARLWLLDEPFTALDDRAIAVLQTVLRQGLAEGRTVIMSTHQLREALELATHVALINRGRLAFAGERTPEMLADPGWLYRNYGEA